MSEILLEKAFKLLGRSAFAFIFLSPIFTLFAIVFFSLLRFLKGDTIKITRESFSSILPIAQPQGFQDYWYQIFSPKINTNGKSKKLHQKMWSIYFYIFVLLRPLSIFSLAGLILIQSPQLKLCSRYQQEEAAPWCKSFIVSKHPELTFQDASRIKTLRQKPTACGPFFLDRKRNSV